MEAFLMYLVKSGTALAAFYLFYHLLFRRQKQFRFNRMYLLLAIPLSYVLPFITFRIEAPPITAPQIDGMAYTLPSLPPETNIQQVDWLTIAIILFAIGCLFFLLKLIIGNIRALTVVRKAPKATLHQIDCFISNQNVHPFTFFNRIIIPREVLNSEHLPVILHHEQIHVNGKHTFDVLVSELLFLLQWFNPFAWLLKEAIKNNLEYLTDDLIIQNTNRQNYQLAMLAMIDKKGVAPFLNALNGSQLKSRILMMKQKTENKKQILRKLLLLPLLTLLVITLSNKKFEAAPLSPESKSVSGIVKASTNKEALPGTSVLIKGTQTGTITNAEGKFMLKVDNFPSTLVFAFPGFEKQEIEVEKPADLSVMLVPANADPSSLRIRPTEEWEPGANPLYIVDGKEVNSIDDIDPETIESISVFKQETAIKLYGDKAKDGVIDIKLKKQPKKQKSKKRGKETGSANPGSAPETIFVVNGKKVDPTSQPTGVIESVETVPGEETKVGGHQIVKIRSVDQTKQAKAKPLIIVNGEEMGQVDVQSLHIDPDEIEKIDVLKDQSAIAKYGEKAKDGVIIITKKK